MKEKLWRGYEAMILDRSLLTLFCVAAIITSLLYFTPRFKLDASADSLVLENDEELRYYRSINAEYGSEDFLVITYTPVQDLFTAHTLARLKALQGDLLALDGIDRVVSILNVPLLNSPRIPLNEIAKTTRTLESEKVDLQLAKREFLESPFYQNLLLSRDQRTTALLAYIKPDSRYRQLLATRERLREIKRDAGLNAQQTHELERVSAAFAVHQADYTKRLRAQIEEVRTTMDKHRDTAHLFLGGVPMIVADMINFIESDLVNFGVAVVLFMLLTLLIIFRQARWIVIPMLCAGLCALAMIGLLGLIGQPVTVVSANFIALLLIITMSMTIHLVVRYRETQARNPELAKKKLIRQTMRFMFEPCLYTSLTTIVAFVSLLVSGIRPVIDFGQIMSFSVVFAFLMVFALFPALLMNLPRGASTLANDLTATFTASLAKLTRQHYRTIIAVCAVIVVLAGIGIAQLKVENRFIDYFKKDTEIHKGMLVIDRQLGGTTPFDLILNAPHHADTVNDELGFEDDLLGDYLSEAGLDQERNEYWLTPYKLEEIKRIHDSLESRPEVGKVLSLATLIRLAEKLNNDQALGDLETSFLRTLLPPEIRRILIDPYLSQDGQQLRFTARVMDSNKQLSRKQLLGDIQTDLADEMSYPSDRFRLTGMLVLYNNMLQSLYESQILTISMVFLMIMLMFVILFRSFKLAAIGIAPNLAAASLVLGFMGWRGIPLDMMTITIAAISVGIAVDNTIHYIIRFKREFKQDYHYVNAIKRCHGSIGKAMYYTSVTITIGFSILTLSNFVPTMYFGLLTSFAMLAAMLASLTLLPSLLIIFKPLGRCADEHDFKVRAST